MCEKSIIDNISHDPDKVIYNFSNYHLTDPDKSLLIKGLNFAIPPKKIEYSKFLLPFELLFRDIKSNSESSVDWAFLKHVYKIQPLHLIQLLTGTTPRLPA